MSAPAIPVPAAMSAPAAPAVPGAAPVPVRNNVFLASEHFAASILYLLAGAIGLVWIAPELSIGAYPSPHVAGITHLFTLGWLSTTIFGALYQLLPVALGAPIRSIKLGHAAFWTFAPGAGLFAAGVATSSTMLHHVGIAFVSVGVILGVGNVAATLPRAKNRDVTWGAISLAIFFLASTLSLGVVLLHNLHTGFLASARIIVLATHLHVALVGWALIMMVGVSHRLLPMFLLSHGGDTRWTKRALCLLAPGVVVLAAGLATRTNAGTWLGTVLLMSGVACFIWQARCFYIKRVRRKTDVGMRFAGTALAFLAVSALLGPAVLIAGVSHPRLATVYVTVGLLGGIVMFIVGFFYKIVPLLAWTVRFKDRMGKGTAPTVAQMFSARVAHAQLALMALAVTLLGAGIATASVHVTRCGAVLFLAGVLLFLSQIARVAVGGRA
jgi:hypothetical protein